MSHTDEMAVELVGSGMTREERLPVLCEIVRRAETLQVRAVAVIISDGRYEETHGSWTSFCRSEFKWDDSYASRMRKAGQMVLDGLDITTEAQARALSLVPEERRKEVLQRSREDAGDSEPTASDIRSTIDEMDDDEKDDSVSERIRIGQSEIDAIVKDMRATLKRIKDLPSTGAGMWINLSHVVADLKNAAEALKHARPHAPCDEWSNHDRNCLCGGTGWLPKHVLDRPKGGNNAS